MYWQTRKNLRYYQAVREMLCGYSGTLADVGCADTPVAQWGKFEKRVAINNREFPALPGVECLQVDWMACEIEKVDVITCLQVIEHFETEYLRQFVNKLFEKSETTIISVPYMWHEGCNQWHPQDPVSLVKLIELVGREPVRVEVVNDFNVLRLVALFGKQNR